MAIDYGRADLLHQYVLVVAGGEDDRHSRELGPIHLVKYAYLADWAYARRHGVTFTGASWQFYHFGPWNSEIYQRIEPALGVINAERKSIASRYQDDFVRFVVHDDVKALRERLEDQLPLGVSGAVQKAVHQFGADTAALLRHIYLSPPMLAAAPGETLDMTRDDSPKAGEATPADQLSVRGTRQRRELIDQLKQKVQRRLHETSEGARSASVVTPPRYDELFVAGTEWLDVLAGEPPTSVEGELVISPEIWKSDTRSDPDVP